MMRTSDNTGNTLRVKNSTNSQSSGRKPYDQTSNSGMIKETEEITAQSYMNQIADLRSALNEQSKTGDKIADMGQTLQEERV